MKLAWSTQRRHHCILFIFFKKGMILLPNQVCPTFVICGANITFYKVHTQEVCN